MHPYFFSSSFLLFFLIFILLLQDVRVSLGQEEENNYDGLTRRVTNCATLNFTCGGLINISYPFWGNGRPDYCGIPGYELACVDDGVTTEIKIVEETYRVLGINQVSNIMTVVRKDFVEEDDACPTDGTFDTIFPDSNLFVYPRDNLTLYYGCPDLHELDAFPNKFDCQTNRTSDTDAYYWSQTFTPGIRPPANVCWRKIEVPVMRTALNRLDSNLSNVTNLYLALREGFDLSYSNAADSITGCYECIKIGGECRYSSTSAPNFKCNCPSNVTDPRCEVAQVLTGKKTNILRKLGIGIGSAVAAVILVAAIFAVIRIILRKKSSTDSSTSIKRMWNKETGNNDHPNVEAFFRNYGSLAPKRFRYMEVKKMTNSFKEKLGQGGFGSVFKGQLHNGRLVAVKVLISKSKNDGQDFINEVASISRTSHVNIVNLLGFCFDGNKRALIYEYMPNGSLDKFIYGTGKQSSSTLGWEILYKVAIGIARGLEYLHRGCNTRILHFDIKPHNILLDEDFSPKISDFGLAKLCPGKESIISMLGARGTAGYIAPEVFSRNFGGISHKSDVYSYGMMVLEMVGGRKNIDVKVGMDHSSQLYYPHWIYDRLKLGKGLTPEEIMIDERGETTKKMIIVGLWCIQTNPSSRPSMSKVLEMLEGSTTALQIPPKPFLSSPPGSPPTSVSSSTISIS